MFGAERGSFGGVPIAIDGLPMRLDDPLTAIRVLLIAIGIAPMVIGDRLIAIGVLPTRLGRLLMAMGALPTRLEGLLDGALEGGMAG